MYSKQKNQKLARSAFLQPTDSFETSLKIAIRPVPFYPLSLRNMSYRQDSKAPTFWYIVARFSRHFRSKRDRRIKLAITF